MQSFPQEKLAHFLLPGPAGQLEVISSWPENNAPIGVAIICHPNPLQAGTMHNKVVTMSAKSFAQLGFATVRFNYRGVGESSGHFGEVLGEQADLRAIVAWVQQVLPTQTIALAGFSFGTYIAASVANEIAASQLVTIAPTVDRHDFNELTDIHCPWLIVQGEEDEVIDCSAVKRFAATPPVPLELVLLADCSHFFHGKLIDLRDILLEKLA